MQTRNVASFLCIAALSACAAVPPQLVEPDRQLVDGQTRCSDIIAEWGHPHASFLDGRLSAYRLVRDAAGYALWTGDHADWDNVQYSLTLVCDDKGILRAHSLVDVKLPATKD